MSNYTVRFDFLRETSVAAWESIVIGGSVRSTCGITVTQVCLWYGAFGGRVLRAAAATVLLRIAVCVFRVHLLQKTDAFR